MKKNIWFKRFITFMLFIIFGALLYIEFLLFLGVLLTTDISNTMSIVLFIVCLLTYPLVGLFMSFLVNKMFDKDIPLNTFISYAPVAISCLVLFLITEFVTADIGAFNLIYLGGITSLIVYGFTNLINFIKEKIRNKKSLKK